MLNAGRATENRTQIIRIFENCISNVIPLLYTDHQCFMQPYPILNFAHNCKSMQ